MTNWKKLNRQPRSSQRPVWSGGLGGANPNKGKGCAVVAFILLVGVPSAFVELASLVWRAL